MPVNLSEPNNLLAVDGVELAVAASEMRYKDRDDLLLIRLAEGSKTAAVFTLNKFCAAPVHLAKKNLSEVQPSILAINAGNANAGTGEQGDKDAATSCDQIANQLNIAPNKVLPFSTGVIGMAMDMKAYQYGVEQASKSLDATWGQAAKAIMTTDTIAKAKSVQVPIGGKTITITGISKGSGMICPNMATMLGYIVTDVNIDADVLQALLSKAADESFNCISVDGDTSTNDSLTLSATGKADNQIIDSAGSSEAKEFYAALLDVAQHLAHAIVRDGEGATKFVEVYVSGASNEDCKAVAYTVAHSPLVKTALFASDPNWGRILAAVGRAPIETLDIDSVDISVNDVSIIEKGNPASSYTEEAGQAAFDQEEIKMEISIGKDKGNARLWTCDFSHEYVSINADYRS